jgi:hypothetical protein
MPFHSAQNHLAHARLTLRDYFLFLQEQIKDITTKVDVRLDVVPLPPRSSSPTVAGCRLGGYLAGDR